MKVERLREAYEFVKNHPYRIDKIGNPKPYGDAIIELGEAFYIHMDKVHFNGKLPKDFGWHIIHDFNSIGYHFRAYGQGIMMGKRSKEYYKTKISHDMRVVEKYLNQIHAYLDTGVFVEFDVYYPGSNPYPGWCRYKYDDKKHAMIRVSHIRDEEAIEHCPKCKTGYFANRSSLYEGGKVTHWFECDTCGHKETRYKDD